MPMAKPKKRKTQHLSDTEIWDDSALIRSWDEAVAEYEASYSSIQGYYHSIHARGEDVEEVLRQAEMAEKTSSKATTTTNGKYATESASTSIEADYEDGEIEDEDLEGPNAPTGKDDGPAHDSERIAAAPSEPNGQARINAHQPSAQTKGSSQVLENIKMAYWWAGYYSGLYEGQQQTTNATNAQEHQEM